jgi:S-adenosylhomocysteine hydrolase
MREIKVMKNKIGNYEIQLQGSSISIRNNGMLTKVIECEPINAIEKYMELGSKLGELLKNK